MKRREFIILTGIGATSAGMLTACGHPEEKLIPALIPDDEYVPGIDVWKASTCGMCDAGCGILVRTRDHKANKIEGNPEHPVNRGALCARGQAGLQVLYNPDRIKAPMKRVGERGSGRFEEITWDEAITTLADKLRDLEARGKTNAAHFFTNDQRGITAHVATRFMEAYGSQAYLVKPFTNEQSTVGGYLNSDSFAARPIFDIAHATYLLSFGARFLETWHSPMMYSRDYGEFRRGQGRVRGKFVQVEPRMSLTGANADEWLPARPNSEALVALALAQVIVREGLAKSAPDAAFSKSLEEYAPEKTAALTDVAAERVIRVAREFARAERPLALASSAVEMSSNVAVIKWANFLNVLVGNLNQKGGVLLPKREATLPLEKLNPIDRFPDMDDSKFPMAIADRPYEVLMVHNFNPAFVFPETMGKLKAIPFIASFSTFLDETTEMADLLLPDHAPLERWDITTTDATGERVINLTQPVVKPEFNTRQTADVLIAISRALGGKIAAAMPIASAEEIVKQDFTALANAGKPPAATKAEAANEGSEEAAEEGDDPWKPLSEKGFCTAKRQPEPASEQASPKPVIKETPDASLLAASKEDPDYPFVFLAYEHPTLGLGEQANLPLLQELPDPLTSVMWGSWLEINPKTAVALGIRDGDLVEVTSSRGAVRAPAVLYPAIRPDTVAMPAGQGHTGYGRYAGSIGINALLLNPFSTTPQARPGVVQVRISKVSGEGKLIRFGTSLPEQIDTKR